MKKTLIQIHKIFGSLISLLFLMWFISGIILVFVGFPHASRQERFEQLRAFNCEALKSIKPFPEFGSKKIEFELYNNTPVYRIYSGRRSQKVIDANTLLHIKSFSKAEAIKTAQNFNGCSVTQVDSLNQLDSWIPWAYYKPLLPFYKCYLNDDLHTVIYVSSKTGLIIQETNRQSRWLARFGAIPHWIYFKQLKQNQQLWEVIVVLLGIIGLIACISGLWVAFYRVKRGSDNKIVALTVYKKWDYKWHHLLGWFLGFLLCTFTLSGIFYTTGIPSWMINKPKGQSFTSQWNKSTSLDSTIHPQQIWKQLPNKMGIRKIAPSSSMNKQTVSIFYDDYRRPLSYQILNNDSIIPFSVSDKEVLEYAKNIFEEDQLTITLQTQYDNYYEANGMFYHPLPVYKIIVDDAYGTTLFIDPTNGKAVGHFDNNKRWKRWLTKGLHKFEFPIFEKYDWLRKVLLIGVLLIGTFMCVTSVVLSWKWFKRVIK